MAHIVSNAPRSSFGLGAIRDFFVRMNEAWEHQARVRRTINELSRLSDAELADLGISRADIVSIAVQSVDETKK